MQCSEGYPGVRGGYRPEGGPDTVRRAGGFALALTLFLVTILAVLAFGAVGVSTMEARTARQDELAAQAMYAARAGISLARARLARDFHWTTGSGRFGESGFDVEAVPKDDNDAIQDKVWRVTSTGFCQQATRQLVAFIGLESFARFCYFTDIELSTSNTPIYFMSRDELDGAVHTNGYFHVAGTPRFASRVTSANGGDSCYDSGDFTYRLGGTQRDPSRFYRPQSSYAADRPTALGGSSGFSFAGGQRRIPLPDSTAVVRQGADRLFVGIHELRFQDSGTVTVLKKSRNRWTVVESLRTDTAPGVTLFVDGEVYVNGTVKGHVTVGASEDIHLNGDLVYANRSRDVMGLVGDSDIIVESPTNVRQDRLVHASMMALTGSFRVADYDKGVNRGTLQVFGGIIQRRRGAVGTLSGSNISTGYAKDYTYDQKLLRLPPPNFPTTGKFVMRSLIDRGSLGGV